MRRILKNENEYEQDGKLFIKLIANCTCIEKHGDEYVLNCKIAQRGEHKYLYLSGTDSIQKMCSNRRLFLDKNAKKTILAEVKNRDSMIADMKKAFPNSSVGPYNNIAVYYKRRGQMRYNFLVEFIDDSNVYGFHYFENAEVKEAVWWLSTFQKSNKMPDNTNISPQEALERNPIYIAAQSKNDVRMQKLLKLHYKVATEKECSFLSKLLGVKIIPSLPEEFNKMYVVDEDTIDVKMLRDSGYTILHRPYFAMQNSTHSKWQLNPHTKSGVDAAYQDAESIAFCEYLALVENCKNKKLGIL